VQVRFNPVAPAGAKSANLVATNAAGTQTFALTGNGTPAPAQQPVTGNPAITPTVALTLRPLTASRGTVNDPNGVSSVTYRWYRLASGATAFGTTPVVTQTAASPTATVTLGLANVTQCTAWKVGATVTDGLGNVEPERMSAPTTRATVIAGGPGCPAVTQPPVPAALAAVAPASTPLGAATAPRLAPTPLAAGSVSVTASSSAPLAVSATVPAGASTVAISLFRLNSVIKRTSKARQKPSSVHIATVYRNAPKAKRYVFRLTEKPFRHLKPGRYLVQVRVGASRTALGPATSRQITIRKARSHTAR
jgi:hypothetical protein